MTLTSDQFPHINTNGLDGEALALFHKCVGDLSLSLQALLDKPAETPVNTIAALWHAAADQPHSINHAIEVALPMLHAAGIRRLHALIAKRLQGVPLAYLTGRQRFMNVELHASAEALIPRLETELLGFAALQQLHEIVRDQGVARVIDVCTGSGNLAVALAYHEPLAQAWGTDLSAEAVALAQRNAMEHKLSDRVKFLAGDLLEPFDQPAFFGTIDLLVCNPPYISSAKVDTLPGEIILHEPRLAFDGGPLGIRILQRLITSAPRFLRENGWLAFEVGLGQGRGMRRRIEQHGNYHDIHEIADKNGEVRALLARSRK